ncbi:MAG: spore coat protein [Clostridiales bacterium]|nr:spore coat protein [Clostridiales bacterium]
MQIQLSQKEQMLLEDAKKQEDICIKKYQGYANQVQDVELKNLLTEIASQEQHHYNMIDQMLQGQQPDMSPSAVSQPPSGGSTTQGFSGNVSDQMLLTDLLSTEKYVSAFYDTAIFEAADPQVRQAIQHIQRDEQTHGEKIFNYMHSHGMYEVKYP